MKIGAFIIPTGIGASIGGFAGDASLYAQEISKYTDKLIVNPNVVNAGCFSGITDNMLYVEGYSLDRFFQDKCCLQESKKNKIGVVFDKSISKGILNVHINTINAVKMIYGIDIIGWDVTDEDVGVEFFVDNSNISTGRVNNINTVLNSAKSLLSQGADTIAVVCRFEDDTFSDYSNGIGVDPVGGVEAIISHYISKELSVPCAHSPAFENIEIEQRIVDKRCSAEYITPTYLPCILIGLNNAPKITKHNGISIKDLDFLVVPHNSLGGIPVFECIKHNIPVFAVKENSTVLDITNDKINGNCTIAEKYNNVIELIKNL